MRKIKCGLQIILLAFAIFFCMLFTTGNGYAQEIVENAEENTNSDNQNDKQPDFNGWYKYNNSWKYRDENGVVYANKWLLYKDKWYYFNNDGDMVTDWQLINNKWYYFSSYGYMKKGWVETDSKWYYMNARGQMTVGWVLWRNNWYYMNARGQMTVGWVFWRDNWYYFDSTGIMVTDKLLKINGVYYYFKKDGHMILLEDQEAAQIASTMDGDLLKAFMYAVDNVEYYGRSLFDSTWTTKELSQYGLHNKQGNCYVKAAVFVELARAMGYDAYLIHSYVRVEGGWARHGYCEIDMEDGQTYVFDPYVRYRFGLEGSYMFKYKTKGTYIYDEDAVVRMP